MPSRPWLYGFKSSKFLIMTLEDIFLNLLTKGDSTHVRNNIINRVLLAWSPLKSTVRAKKFDTQNQKNPI